MRYLRPVELTFKDAELDQQRFGMRQYIDEDLEQESKLQLIAGQKVKETLEIAADAMKYEESKVGG